MQSGYISYTNKDSEIEVEGEIDIEGEIEAIKVT